MAFFGFFFLRYTVFNISKKFNLSCSPMEGNRAKEGMYLVPSLGKPSTSKSAMETLDVIFVCISPITTASQPGD